MKRIHYSWFILCITFFSILVAGIIISSTGVFIVPFESEFGWDRSVITLAFAVSLILYGISGPFMAALLEVIGLKKNDDNFNGNFVVRLPINFHDKALVAIDYHLGIYYWAWSKSFFNCSKSLRSQSLV